MRHVAIAVIGVLAAGCGSDGSTGSNGAITIEGGANQTGEVGIALQPYSVKVSNGSGPVDGLTVSWQVASGGGSVSPISSVTNGQGIAEAVATLGTQLGSQTVRASASGFGSVIFTATAEAGPPVLLVKSAGDGQVGKINQALPQNLQVRLTDQYQNPVSGQSVSWALTSGAGSISAASSTTGLDGTASIVHAMGATAGTTTVTATVTGLGTVTFDSKAIVPLSFSVLGGGNNVPDRTTSDLWVKDGFGYTGTWGGNGNAVFIWQLDGNGSPVLYDSIVVKDQNGPTIGTVSDIQVSEDGKWLAFTAEGGPGDGLYAYELTSPGTPVFRAKTIVSAGLHTGTLADIGGKLYAFTAKDPPSCALKIFDLSQAGSGTITQASSTPIPDNYCIHDTFVRDGYAFVFAWNEGLYIFDVGNGSHGGSPTHPVQLSHTHGFGGETHNGWWFWNPNGEKRYLFIGEEGPFNGSNASGDIHVVDVSDFSAPVEVGFFHIPNAGTHNFWVDEPNQILYAAFYNAGVVALDISGIISGNMASRELARIQPGGAGNTLTWGVMLYNGSVYASDMLSGFWQVSLPH
jgi:hypothetical protein